MTCQKYIGGGSTEYVILYNLLFKQSMLKLTCIYLSLNTQIFGFVERLSKVRASRRKKITIKLVLLACLPPRTFQGTFVTYF